MPGEAAGDGPDEAELIRTAPQPSDRVATELAHTILPTSGAMIGVCATLVGLVKLNENRSGPSVVDEVGALIAIVFLASCVLSYAAIRLSHRRPAVARRCERFADVFFIAGLVSLVGLAAVFAFELV